MTRVTLAIGGRILTSVTRRDPDLDTLWTVEHPIKNTADLKAFLELPDEYFSERVDIQPLLEEEQRLGDRGIVMVDTEDPLCAAATLLSMQDYTVVAFTEPRLFHQLLEKLSRQIHARTAAVASRFPGRLWCIYGPEYASEPYLPPRLFEEYVVRYDAPMVDMIQRHGGFVRIHCHGRIRNILDHIVAMGADAIDPIEPPPQGDVQLAEVRVGDTAIVSCCLAIWRWSISNKCCRRISKHTYGIRSTRNARQRPWLCLDAVIQPVRAAHFAANLDQLPNHGACGARVGWDCQQLT